MHTTVLENLLYSFEQDVKFMIFYDGRFDFNTEIQNNVTETYYRLSLTIRDLLHTTYGAKRTVHRVHYAPPKTKRCNNYQ